MLLLNAYRELPITGEHAVTVGTLPLLHKDPFDRMLIAQARAESIMLITADSNVSAYGANILKV
jgi:PIN domain nuclease of toxin-antitoxin system